MALSSELKSTTKSLLSHAFEKAMEMKTDGIFPTSKVSKLIISDMGNISIKSEDCPNILGLAIKMAIYTERSSEFEKFRKIALEDPVLSKHVNKNVGTFEQQFYFRPVDLLQLIFTSYFMADKELAFFDEDIFEQVCDDIEDLLGKNTIRQEYLAILENLATDLENEEISESIFMRGLSNKDVQDLWSENSLIQSHYDFGSFMYVPPTRIKSTLYVRVDEPKIINERGKTTIDSTKAPINLLKPRFERIVTALRLLRLGSVRLGPVIHKKPLLFPGEQLTHGGPPASYPPLFEYRLSKDDVEEVKVIIRALEKIDQSNKIFKVGLDRINMAVERENPEDALLDVMICCEAFLLNDIREPGELTYRMALRAAILLGKNPKEKSGIFQTAKMAYKLRSKIIHGNLLSAKEKENLQEAIDLGRRIAREMVLLNAKGVTPNWETWLFQ
jgi:hypothetical protein